MMANKRVRARSIRRDRRKAKASGWKRAGKTSMGNRIGHGPNGSTHALDGRASAPLMPDAAVVKLPRARMPKLKCKHCGKTHRLRCVGAAVAGKKIKDLKRKFRLAESNAAAKLAYESPMPSALWSLGSVAV